MNPGTVYTALIAALVALCGYAIYLENARWVEFSATHHCKRVGETTGSSSVGYAIGANGQGAVVTAHTPGKTGYLCDDGITYWR